MPTHEMDFEYYSRLSDQRKKALSKSIKDEQLVLVIRVKSANLVYTVPKGFVVRYDNPSHPYYNLEERCQSKIGVCFL